MWIRVAGEKRRQGMAEVIAANRQWKEKSIDPAAFRSAIAPQLKTLKLAALMQARD